MAQLVPVKPPAADLPARQTSLARCSACAMRKVCVPENATAATLGSLETLIQTARPLRRGQYLYASGHTLRYLFAVRSGSLKLVTHTSDGSEQIVGVYGAGDAVGLDGLATGRYAFDCVALRDASVCLIPYERFTQLCRDVPAVQQRLVEIMGRQFVRDATMKMLAGIQPVEARVAAFLMEAARRSARLGFSSKEFTIGMTRAEIGNYLGTTLETVSRVLSALSRDGILEVRGKRIQILDFDKLEARAVSNATKPGQATVDEQPERHGMSDREDATLST